MTEPPLLPIQSWSLVQANQIAEKALSDPEANDEDVGCAPKLLEVILQVCWKHTPPTGTKRELCSFCVSKLFGTLLADAIIDQAFQLPTISRTLAVLLLLGALA